MANAVVLKAIKTKKTSKKNLVSCQIAFAESCIPRPSVAKSLNMTRYHLILEYDGSSYVGWQRQDNGLSIQEVLETAVEGFSGGPSSAVAAGRTDAGVHARAMSAHIDLDKDYTADVVRDAVNHHMRPHPIAVISATQVTEEFHARFSATARHYEYRLVSRRAPLALNVSKVWRIPQPLDVIAMNVAAQCLVGQHDFTTFRAAQCQAKSPVKTLSSIRVLSDDDEISVEVSAPSFLHHQVRSIVGSLVQVGLSRWTTGDFATALTAKDRRTCGPVAPPDGLYFIRADYPDGLS